MGRSASSWLTMWYVFVYFSCMSLFLYHFASVISVGHVGDALTPGVLLTTQRHTCLHSFSTHTFTVTPAFGYCFLETDTQDMEYISSHSHTDNLSFPHSHLLLHIVRLQLMVSTHTVFLLSAHGITDLCVCCKVFICMPVCLCWLVCMTLVLILRFLVCISVGMCGFVHVRCEKGCLWLPAALSHGCGD